MDSFMNQALQAWVEKKSQVQALLETGRRANPAAVHQALDPYEYDLVVDSDEEMILGEDWGAVFDDQVIQQGLLQSGPLRTYRILLAKDRRIQWTVGRLEALLPRIEKDSLAKPLYDPQGLFSERMEANDLSYRIQRPEAQAMEECCQRFFAYMTDVALALVEEQIFPALLAFAKARENLMEMTLPAVAARSSFSVNLGQDGSNLRAYMGEVEYDHLLRSYSSARPDRIWDALFQACMLFRKEGMALDELGVFSYPRKLDVEMMQYFRKLWEGVR